MNMEDAPETESVSSCSKIDIKELTLIDYKPLDQMKQAEQREDGVPEVVQCSDPSSSLGGLILRRLVVMMGNCNLLTMEEKQFNHCLKVCFTSVLAFTLLRIAIQLDFRRHPEYFIIQGIKLICLAVLASDAVFVHLRLRRMKIMASAKKEEPLHHIAHLV